jgi:hypothetical protein
MATVQDLQSAVIDAAHANAQAARAIAKAATDRDRPDEIAAVEAAKGDGGGGGEPRKPKRAQTIRARVIRVIDGDTLVIRPLEAPARPRYTCGYSGSIRPRNGPKNAEQTSQRRIAAG